MRLCTLLLFVFSAILYSCGVPGVDTSCRVAAQTFCERCFDCAGDLSTVELCGNVGTRSECESQKIRRCESQASTMEEPDEALVECTDSIEAEDCDALYVRRAQNRPPSTPECRYYL